LLLRQLARMHHDKAQFLLGDPSRAILHLDPAEYTVAMPAGVVMCWGMVGAVPETTPQTSR
jgi:hypothetical protein